MARVAKHVLIFTVVAIMLWAGQACAEYANFDECMDDSIRTARDEITIGEIRTKCAGYLKKPEVKEASVEKRLEEEMESELAQFGLTAHRPNYILPMAYNSTPNYEVYKGTIAEGVKLDDVEIKFQFSIKYLLFDDIFKDNGNFYIAYTNLSFWQAYNSKNSSPFRDTNHEPEMWLQFNTDWELFWGIKTRLVTVGLIHQSNGRSEPLSRKNICPDLINFHMEIAGRLTSFPLKCFI